MTIVDIVPVHHTIVDRLVFDDELAFCYQVPHRSSDAIALSFDGQVVAVGNERELLAETESKLLVRRRLNVFNDKWDVSGVQGHSIGVIGSLHNYFGLDADPASVGYVVLLESLSPHFDGCLETGEVF
ncbi:hypothetical protein PG996_008908 [Apiospora saccharicola]|uniref:Uncharacterized protein n=1 Tax=Apiospora saccharicola TaxID=335842 RepID=A0ABR1UZA5_9PEZI